MAVYIIGDLHLSFSVDKPMDIFGDKWQGYDKKIKKNWEETVKEEDTVIIAGDFSWATYLEDTKKDFEFINNLPGKKILLKGNHDYWWSTIKHMEKFLKANNFLNISFLYNNSIKVENIVLVGTRGWALTDLDNTNKMMNREAIRLELSINDAINKYGENCEKIAVMHYPPLIKTDVESLYENKYLQILKKYNIKKCYYGHLHGNSHAEAVEGNVYGIDFKLISGDYIDFKMQKIN